MNFVIILSAIRFTRGGSCVREFGSVPRSAATVRIDHFIAEGGTGPYPDMG
jgi:hypothetical protein